jgi:acetyl esterase/lipase
MVFSIYYLVCAEAADEKVRKVRSSLTVEHLRVSWDKAVTNPYLNFCTTVLRPRFMRYKPRAIRIRRPPQSSYSEPVNAWLYFDGPISSLKEQRNVVLDIPGGGFVAMSPRTHDDKLIAWAGRTGFPVLSLDYKKAPEHPYPYALNECYDVYHTLIASRGRCIGMSGEVVPKVVMSGESAGGNLVVGTVLMILQAGSTDGKRWQGEAVLPPPEGVILVYPALDMNIGNWMTDEQMALIRDRRTRKQNQGVLKRKSEDYTNLDPSTPHHSDDEDNGAMSPLKENSETIDTSNRLSAASSKLAANPSAGSIDEATQNVQASKPRTLKTRLAMSSMISYFNDRVLAPEMMRAMIILYIGPHTRPDFSTDYFLSPILAPEALLQRFPKTWLVTGERDPLVDDTVIFAGRLRQAKRGLLLERKELGLEKEGRQFKEEDVVQVSLIPGISHGFLQFVGVFPEGWRHIFRCAGWIQEAFGRSVAEEEKREKSTEFAPWSRTRANTTPPERRHHRRMRTESSGDEDRPLEMTVLRPKNGPGRNEKARNGVVREGRVGKDGKVKGERVIEKRRRSLVSLASEEDLLGRRMKGLTQGLILMEDGTPPTP